MKQCLKKYTQQSFLKSGTVLGAAEPCLFVWQYYTKRQLECQPKIEYTEDGIPTKTTSLKNVGLSAPERSGVEYASVDCVYLSLQ